MLIVSEETCRKVVNNENAFAAVKGAFAAMARGDAYNFPVVREAIGHADALFGFKSGFDRAAGVLGLKAGEGAFEGGQVGDGEALFRPRCSVHPGMTGPVRWCQRPIRGSLPGSRLLSFFSSENQDEKGSMIRWHPSGGQNGPDPYGGHWPQKWL
jgi:hypothetical protein